MRVEIRSALLGCVARAVGCHVISGLDSVEANPDGSGAAAPASSSTGDNSGAAGGMSGVGAGGDAGGNSSGGSGGAGGCQSPPDCPGDDTTCEFRTCIAAVCGMDVARLGTECTADNGEVCDGDGNCVAAGCIDAQKNGDETDVDCGGSCEPCDNGLMCIVAVDCDSQFCDQGTCAACSTDTDCDEVADSYCNVVGKCRPKKAQGAPCPAGNSACQNDICVDGYCCNNTCEGACDACNLAPLGECQVIAASSAGDPACSPYLCDGTNAACPMSCVDNTDCVATGYCDLATFECGDPKKSLGAACSGGSECASIYCVDDVCCNEMNCAGSCNACDVDGSGTCQPIPGCT